MRSSKTSFTHVFPCETMERRQVSAATKLYRYIYIHRDTHMHNEHAHVKSSRCRAQQFTDENRPHVRRGFSGAPRRVSLAGANMSVLSNRINFHYRPHPNEITRKKEAWRRYRRRRRFARLQMKRERAAHNTPARSVRTRYMLHSARFTSARFLLLSRARHHIYA